MEGAEVGSSNGLENRGDLWVNSSMLSPSAKICWSRIAAIAVLL